jgi:hypothetical protein
MYINLDNKLVLRQNKVDNPKSTKLAIIISCVIAGSKYKLLDINININ